MFNETNISTLQFNPVTQSPLHHFGLVAKQESINSTKGVWANEIPLLGYISLRGNAQNSAFTKAAKLALGVALPTQPCSMATTSWGSILWLAPDEWLLICERAQRPTLPQALETSLEGIHCQVVDNSGGFTTVLLQGKNASDVLYHCTVYDLNALETDKVVGSTFGKTSLFLHKQDDGYSLIFRRSFADYIWRYLERSALPYGFGIAVLSPQKSIPVAKPSASLGKAVLV
ncbi:MAG: sarcosine oxidase subunit gamma family protein [Methylotenera sp.]